MTVRLIISAGLAFLASSVSVYAQNILTENNLTGTPTTGLGGTVASGSYYTPAHTATLAEPPSWTRDSTSVRESRFAAYKALGVTTIRVSVAWSEIENTYGVFTPIPEISYMKAAIQAGFRLKIVVFTAAGEPYSYFQNKPNSNLVDAKGNVDPYLWVSPWLPGYNADLHEVTDRIMSQLAGVSLDAYGNNWSGNLLPDGSNILSHADAIGPTYGTAGENLYPSAGYLSFTPGFWAYDVNAQLDFTTKMNAKYGSIAAANAAWGTSYAAFPAPPKPGASGVTPAEWSDFLFWYRNEKRAFAVWQLHDTMHTLQKYMPTNTPLVEIPIAGLHLTTEQFNSSVTSIGANDADNDDSIIAYTDNEFLIDLVHQNPGSQLHITSLPNTAELSYTRQYEAAVYGNAAPMEGENNGHDNVPIEMANNAISFNMTEIDQIDGTDLFLSDHMSPNATYAAYKNAWSVLSQEWAGTQPYTQTYNANDYAFILQANTCIPVDPNGTVKACLSQQNQFQIFKNNVAVWTAPSNPTTYSCKSGVPYNETCVVEFNGNLFQTKDGQNQVWNSAVSGSSGNGNNLVFTISPPYMQIQSDSGVLLWSTGLTPSTSVASSGSGAGTAASSSGITATGTAGGGGATTSAGSTPSDTNASGTSNAGTGAATSTGSAGTGTGSTSTGTATSTNGSTSTGTTAANATIPAQQIGIVDYNDYIYQSAGNISQRMRLYGALGATNVLGTVGWADSNASAGVWSTPTQLPYMQAAVAAGMRLKLDLQTIASPPDWFFTSNPSARLLDSNGQTTTRAVSYWYPDLQSVMSNATDNLLRMLAAGGVLSHVDYVFASLGAADEPLYPAAWTLASTAAAPGFWYFDLYAQADFRVQMQALYHTIANANAAWSTSYSTWSDVTPPKPSMAKGRFWSDTLIWYRQAKRKFIAWQVENTLALLRKYSSAGHVPVLELIVPGDHISAAEWDLDVQNGATASADAGAVTMTDTEFLIDLAAQTGSAIEFTNLPDSPELEYIQNYITSHNYKVAVMGENTGDAQSAVSPNLLAAEAFGLGLTGLDFVESSYLFGNNGLTPNTLYGGVQVADLQLAKNWQAGSVSSLSLPQNFIVINNGCVTLDRNIKFRLCVSNQGSLQVLHGSTIVWDAHAPAQQCATNNAWQNGCFLAFQGDGNLVLYNHGVAYWATGTNGSKATQLVVSGTAPYVQIQDAASNNVWSSGH